MPRYCRMPGHQPLCTRDIRMLDLMGSTKEDGSTPLYIHVVHKIIREMRMNQQLTGESFNYPAFKAEIGNADLTPAQLVPLFQRLAILQSFMWQASENKKRRKRGLETYNATQWTNEVSKLVALEPHVSTKLFHIAWQSYHYRPFLSLCHSGNSMLTFQHMFEHLLRTNNLLWSSYCS